MTTTNSPTASGRIRAGDRKLPHPPYRLPVLGDVWDLHVTDSSQWGMRGAQRYGGIYERNILGARVTYVSDPDLLREINDDSLWAKFLGIPLRDLRKVAGDGLFTAHNSEPNWAKARAILAPSFTAGAMRGYHATMQAVAAELVDYWSARPGVWLDIPADTNKAALEVIGRAAFGYEFQSFRRTDEHPVVAAMLRSLSYLNRAAYSHPLIERTVRRDERAQHRRDVEFVNGTIDDVIARRMREGTGEHDDLLDRMLTVPDPETGELLDPTNVRHQILTFLTAGHETTAGVLAFALHYLSLHPEIADRARKEIAEVWTADEITFDQVAKLRYLRRIIDETLRLWPTAPGYFRKAKQDTMLGGKHPFERGEWVFIVLLQLHRHELWGGDPEDFDPDRFTPERNRSRHPELYRPFGVGARACIGRQFAYHEMQLVLATVLRHFDLTPDPNYRLRVKETITLKPEGLRLKLSRRDG
ncbi:Cytochrome P450(BM-3) [Nocardia otitidiscaviarum]|uniref:Cytochrome P450(BM-3) n=1 Tax=Nocardia otitidiscaviarum TaxID=1823 RepID=A0A379JLS1_9NOCA|nr:cytochrome P450 [Nocardia otitidiscaviarum]SUD49567.1 Cytochrome P450(BM-3) [Nocardia otitidiscaviarum]